MICAADFECSIISNAVQSCSEALRGSSWSSWTKELGEYFGQNSRAVNGSRGVRSSEQGYLAHKISPPVCYYGVQQGDSPLVLLGPLGPSSLVAVDRQ